MAGISPFNLVQLPFLPFSMFWRMKQETQEKLNDFVMKLQYIMFMSVFYVFFIAFGILMLPVAYVICMVDKYKTLNKQTNQNEKFYNNLLFFPFGLGILALDFGVDMIFFWTNNFRKKEELKLTIIPRETYSVSHESIRKIMS